VNGEVRVGKPVGVFRAENGAFRATRCGTIPREMWEDIVEFQRPMPPLPPNYPARLIADALRETPQWNEVPWAREVERKISLNPGRSVVWSFVALDKPGEGIHVMSAVLGEERVVQWTWSDQNIKLPVLEKIVAVINFFGRLVGKIR